MKEHFSRFAIPCENDAVIAKACGCGMERGNMNKNNMRCGGGDCHPAEPHSTGCNTPANEDMRCNQCVIDMIGYAQAYVPSQQDTSMLEPEQGLISGTIYSALNMPYVKGSALKRFSGEE